MTFKATGILSLRNTYSDQWQGHEEISKKMSPKSEVGSQKSKASDFGLPTD